MIDTELNALQETLAAEHAAVFVLAALGGRASALAPSALRQALDTAYAVHVERRDRLRTVIEAAGASPVAAEAAYRLPSPLESATRIAAEALRVTNACTASYAALVAATTDDRRRWAVDALVASAVSEPGFGGHPEALPGLERP